jgi:kynurenine formamidase
MSDPLAMSPPAVSGAPGSDHRLVDLTLLVAEEAPCWWSTHMPFQHKTFDFFADRADDAAPLLSRTGPYQTRWLLMDEHTGTHVDAPAHFVPPPGSGPPGAGKHGTVTVDRVPLGRLTGPAAVIDVPEDLAGAGPGSSPIIGPEFADAPSMGSAHDGAPVHVGALSQGVVFVEALHRLDRLPPRGAFSLFTPLKIARGTGAPGRAMAWVPIRQEGGSG